MLAQVAQRNLRHDVVTHQLISRLCEENLPTVSGGHQARGSIERWAEVVDLALLGWAGVQPHPCPERANFAPRLGQERTLSLHCGGEGRVGCTKGGQETVAHGLDHVAQMRLNGAPQDGIVSGDRHLHRLGMLLPKLGAALDIGEKEGDGTGGSLGHGSPPVL